MQKTVFTKSGVVIYSNPFTQSSSKNKASLFYHNHFHNSIKSPLTSSLFVPLHHLPCAFTRLVRQFLTMYLRQIARLYFKQIRSFPSFSFSFSVRFTSSWIISIFYLHVLCPVFPCSKTFFLSFHHGMFLLYDTAPFFWRAFQFLH